MTIKSYDALNNRNYQQEQRKAKKLQYQGFVDTIIQQPLSFHAFATASALVAKEHFKNNKKLNEIFSADKAFETIRLLESRVPIFNIPLRTTQVGDMLSPFVSDKALKWQYGGTSLLNESGTALKHEFKFLEELAGRSLNAELNKPGVEVKFEKTGKVYGRLVINDGSNKKILADDIFMMQRPSSKTGALSSIFDAGKRPTNFFKALDKEWGKTFEDMGFSEKWADKLRYAGGVAKTIAGETFHEFIKGANRFLKEPVPGLNFLLDWEIEKKTFASKMDETGELGKPLARMFRDKMGITVSEKDPLGRLPRFLRPYVTSEAWQKSSLRMLTALSAKGALLTTVIPSLYGGLDYARDKMEGLPMPVKSTIMGMVGAGIGGLIKSKDVDFGVFRGSKLLTKTQLGGAALGLLAGLPVFDRGLTAGFGSLFGSLNIAGARAWNLVGGQDARRRQEELFPGMTNPLTGVGFAMGGGFIGYFHSELGLMSSYLPKKPLEVGGLSGEKLLEYMTDVAAGRKESTSMGSFLADAFTQEKTGRVASVSEASKILKGTTIDGGPKTVLGSVAEVYRRLGTEQVLDSGMQAAHSTFEGAEEAAQRLFTHLREITDASRKSDLALKNESAGFFGKIRNKLEHHLTDRPGFWRGFTKGAIAFAGIAQLGAIVAGPAGGNFNPINLVPGWLINLTGGGRGAQEAEDVFTGKEEVAVRKGRWWALGSSSFEGCLIPETKVILSDGTEKEAKDIKKGDLLINIYGEQTPVVGISTREANQELTVKIKTYYNQKESLVVTGNHPILVSKDKTGNNLQWTRADEVVATDLLFIPHFKHKVETSSIDVLEVLRDNYEYENNQWYTKRCKPTMHSRDVINAVLYWGSLKRRSKERSDQLALIIKDYGLSYKQIKYLLGDLRKGGLSQRRAVKNIKSRKIDLNENFGRLLGYYAAEGCATESGGGICLVFHEDEVNYQIDFINLIHEVFGLETSIRKSDSSRGVALVVNSKLLEDLIKYLVPGKAREHNKLINPILLSAPIDFLKGFVDGFIKGDGYIRSDTISIGLAPSLLINQLQLIFNKLGVISKVGPIKTTKNNYKTQEIVVGKEGTKRLSNLIQIKERTAFLRVIKNYNFFEIPGGYLVKITELEHGSFSGLVYDFEVADGSSFLTPQCLIHNSKIEYFRQHRAVLSQSDAEDNALYGSKDEKIAYDPVLHPLRALFDNEFKYHRDTRLSEISPTPLTSRMFSDVPILGDVLSSTIGQLIKPQKMIRPNEWHQSNPNPWSARSFVEQPVQSPQSYGEVHQMRTAPPVQELGGESQLYARNSLSLYQTGRNTLKRINEQVGLRGFLFSNTLAETTGYQETSYDPVIESGDRTFSARTKFWSMNLGDPFGTCFVGSTLVNTIFGKIPIKDVKPGDLVLSLDGEFKQVVGTIKHETHNKKLIKFTYGDFEGSFTCTENHWIPTIKHSISRDKQAKDFVVGDLLIVPVPQENLFFSSINNYNLAYYFGYMAGKSKDISSIPYEIFFGGLNVIESYVKGVFKGGRRKTVYPSKHKNFVIDLWKLMKTIDIDGDITFDGSDWKWTVQEESKRKLVDFLIKDIPPGCRDISYITIPITSIEILEHTEPVYDLEIESLHYYVVEDVAVHNTEGLRRYLTKDRNTYYNPLSNMAPSWLPKDNFYIDFSKGNYFNLVNEGAIRLPGAGLETLNPELEGLHPENYSVGWKYKILSDVAYGSTEWALTKDRVKGKLALGELSERDQELVSMTNRQLEQKKIKKSFRKYQFDGKDELVSRELTISGVYDDGTFTALETGSQQLTLGGSNMSMAAISRQHLERGNARTIAEANHLAEESKHNILEKMRSQLKAGTKVRVSMKEGASAFENQKTDVFIEGLSKDVEEMGAERKDEPLRAGQQFNAFQKLFGRAWELYTHNADLPVTPAMLYNKISPFQPHSKFIKRLSPTELYAQQRVYGRELQMWQNYKEDFIDPVIHDITRRFTGDYIPTRVAYERTMVEYFDKLKWLKNYMLEQSAIQTGRDELAEFFREKKKQTIYGADPYRGMSDIWRALPGTERDFYKDFAEETDEKERERILQLAPEMMKRIYIANWQNKDMRGLARKAEAGVASQDEKALLRNLYKLRATEGFTETAELKQQYENESRGTEISYADWVRIKELKEYFKAFKLPEKDFVGFDPRVDLEDIKLKVAQNEGVPIHNIGLWDQQAASIRRKPYVSAGASLIANWHEGDPMNEDFEGRVRRTIGGLTSLVSLTPLPGANSRVVMQAQDTRHGEIKHFLTKGAF